MPTYNLASILEPMLNLLDENEVGDMIYHAADRAGIEAVRIIKDTYPPEPPGPGAPSPLRTPRQWRWWWAMMNEIANGRPVPDSLRGWKAKYVKVGGHRKLKLSGHYKRSGLLIRSISYDTRRRGSTVVIDIGPTMARSGAKPGEAGEYARYVIGKGTQAAIHKGRWEPLVDIIEANSKVIFQAFMKDLADQFAVAAQREVRYRGLQ